MAALAQEIGDPLLLFHAHNNRLLGEVWVGNRDAADRDLAAMEVLAARLRQPALEARARTMRCAHTLLSGRLEDAEVLIGELAQYQEKHGLPGWWGSDPELPAVLRARSVG